MTVPYAGRVQVAGRTQQQVEAAIVDRLRGKAIEPQALVNVSRNVSNTVTVTGEVSNGSRVPLTLRGDRIMDVIAAAGGYRSPVHETFVSLTRGGRARRALPLRRCSTIRKRTSICAGDIVTVAPLVRAATCGRRRPGGSSRRRCAAACPPMSTPASTSFTWTMSPPAMSRRCASAEIGERYILGGENFTLRELLIEIRASPAAGRRA